MNSPHVPTTRPTRVLEVRHRQRERARRLVNAVREELNRARTHRPVLDRGSRARGAAT